MLTMISLKLRGIKIKERVVGSSKRPKSALEKLTKKRRTQKIELQYSSGVDSICVPTTKVVPRPLLEFSQVLYKFIINFIFVCLLPCSFIVFCIG